jgi:hypothetical protein
MKTKTKVSDVKESATAVFDFRGATGEHGRVYRHALRA